MPREAKPFEFDLTPEEASYMTDTPITGSGGRQSLQRKLKKQLEDHPCHVVLTDAELGRLCRYIGRYEDGGAQDRFRNAFGRVLKELLGI